MVPGVRAAITLAPFLFPFAAPLQLANMFLYFMVTVVEIITTVHEVDFFLSRLSNLPSNGLANLLNLETLSLASNQIARLAEGGLSGLLALQTLSLTANRLVALPASAFTGLQLLRELRLDNNSLSSLQPGLFRSLDNLLVLNLSRNHLTAEGAAGGGVAFNGLRRLVALDLSYTRLEAVEMLNLQSLTSLQILNLSHNRYRYRYRIEIV